MPWPGSGFHMESPGEFHEKVAAAVRAPAMTSTQPSGWTIARSLRAMEDSSPEVLCLDIDVSIPMPWFRPRGIYSHLLWGDHLTFRPVGARPSGQALVHGDVGAQNRQVRANLRKDLAATEALVEVDAIAVFPRHKQRTTRSR